MKVVIVEDEVIAAATLERMLKELRPDYEIAAVLQTVEEGIEWFNGNGGQELVFMDIHLADGSSFAIFEKAEVNCPIIFTTAYNEYALDAFEVNGIDYLLKPINKPRLEKAISKFEGLGHTENNGDMIARLLETIESKQSKVKRHFLIPHKDKLVPLAVDDVAYIYAELKAARVVTFGEQTYSLDYSLDEMMKKLDPEQFFRVNRQCIVSHRSVQDISVWFAGKLAVNLKVPVPERIMVSKARVSDFKAWFTKGL